VNETEKSPSSIMQTTNEPFATETATVTNFGEIEGSGEVSDSTTYSSTSTEKGAVTSETLEEVEGSGELPTTISTVTDAVSSNAAMAESTQGLFEEMEGSEPMSTLSSITDVTSSSSKEPLTPVTSNTMGLGETSTSTASSLLGDDGSSSETETSTKQEAEETPTIGPLPATEVNLSSATVGPITQEIAGNMSEVNEEIEGNDERTTTVPLSFTATELISSSTLLESSNPTDASEETENLHNRPTTAVVITDGIIDSTSTTENVQSTESTTGKIETADGLLSSTALSASEVSTEKGATITVLPTFEIASVTVAVNDTFNTETSISGQEIGVQLIDSSENKSTTAMVPIAIDVMVTTMETPKTEESFPSTVKAESLPDSTQGALTTESSEGFIATTLSNAVSGAISIIEISTISEDGEQNITPEQEITTTVTYSNETKSEDEMVTEQQTSKKPPRDFCIFKGMIIQNLADVPSKDDCELCQCVDGEIVCARRVCEEQTSPSCHVLPLESGQCCPKYDCSDMTTEADIDIIKTTQTSIEVQEDDVDEEEETENEEVTTEASPPVTFTIASTLTSPKPVTTTQLTTLLTTMISQEGAITTVTPAGIQQNANGTFGTASGDILSEEDYDDLDLDSLGPGACLFEGKIYVSAQQIPRDNPCDFCFCFRGDIICLQQSCPPPIPGCKEEIIPGFCCPRYECPVKMSFHNITRHVQHQPEEPPSLASWFGWGKKQGEQVEDEVYQTEVKGCEVQGEFYEAGALVDVSSGPCLQCR